MRRAIGFKKLCAIDRRVELGRRKRGVAQKLLDRAQIAATFQKMGRERMAQRMRRGAFWQAKRPAQAFDCELDDAG